MPLPFFLAALLGKAAATVLTKAVTTKSVAAGTKAIGGHHGRHSLVWKIVGKAMDKAVDKAVDRGIDAAVRSKKDNKKKRRA